MSLQTVVNRQYTEGFIGEIIEEGPTRGKPGRIASASTQSDGSTNRFGRVFGYLGESGAPDDTTAASSITIGGSSYPVGRAALVNTVQVGGTVFYGIMGNPKHNALQGTAAGGSLAPSIDLPQGAEAEFFDMVTTMVVQIVNPGTAAQTVSYGDYLAYVPMGISSANNPLGLPLGAIVSYAKNGGTLPTGFLQVPNAFVKTPLTIAASAAGALAGSNVKIQMTN